MEYCGERIRVVTAGETIADTTRAIRVLETSHPPVYYIPPDDIRTEFLSVEAGQSFCEYKGLAQYWTLDIGAVCSHRAAWSYMEPTREFLSIQGFFAIYASRVDECWVGSERAYPQAGDFYGGWITSRIVGPFKGSPGTMGW